MGARSQTAFARELADDAPALRRLCTAIEKDDVTYLSLDVKVVRKTVEARDVCSFELADILGRALPPFSAGSHIDVHLPGGTFRQYSLCNDPREQHRYLIGVLRDPASRGGSIALFDSVHEGDVLRISEPRNHFALAAGARHSLLLAGGIGVTPLLCMAERLANVGASFEMHYCARSRERAAFIDRIAASGFAGKVRCHFDDGTEEQKLDARALLGSPKSGVHLYVCGPTGFMTWLLEAAKSAGWPDERVHREFFGAAPIDHSGDGAFEIKLASSGAVITVGKDQTIVAALAAHGVELPTSCDQGVCGTCLTRVLEGELDHRDQYLTEAERAKGDQFLPCCSRAKSSRLVLDL